MSAPLTHSEYSASGFEAAMLCPGKVVLERGKPDTSSKYADEGTAAHTVLSWVVEQGKPARAFLGRRVPVGLSTWEVTDEMATAVQTAADNIAVIAQDGMVLSEQRVNYADYLAVDRDLAWGTSDIIALCGDELQVHDYKHGMGVVVTADDNPQMKLYALGALELIRAMGEEPTTARLVIHQPRVNAEPSQWTCTIAELEAWGRGAARSAVATRRNAISIGAIAYNIGVPGTENPAWQKLFLRPNDKSCKFCKAKATCPALRSEAFEMVLGSAPAAVDEFEVAAVPSVEHIKVADSAWLAAVLEKADRIEGWLAAVRAETERRLLAGESVPRFKLVQGKRGNRSWGDPAAAEEMLKGMRLKVEEMYDLKLISPTTAEKLAKPAKKEGDPAPLIGPRQWAKVQALITQADGKPHVAPATDPRPALALAAPADDFETVSTTNHESEFA